MKEYTNPSYTDETLAEEEMCLDGVVFRLAALRQSLSGDTVLKMVFVVDVNDNDNGSARLQKDFTSAHDMKKLGIWLLETAARIEAVMEPERLKLAAQASYGATVSYREQQRALHLDAAEKEPVTLDSLKEQLSKFMLRFVADVKRLEEK